MQKQFGWDEYMSSLNSHMLCFPNPVIVLNSVKFYNYDEIVAWNFKQGSKNRIQGGKSVFSA